MYTVVVADDEEEIRRALIRKVDWEEIGFVVVGEAENGAEALEMWNCWSLTCCLRTSKCRLSVALNWPE